MVTNISKRRVALLPALAGIVALAVAISAGIAPTPSGAGAGIASASSGGWVLKSTEASKYDEDNYPNDCYSGHKVTVAGLSATTYVRCTSTGPTYDVYQRSQHSWSAAPPERLAPGEVLRITSTTSVEGTFGTIGLGGGATTWVRIDLSPGGGPYPGYASASATEENTPVSAVSEFSIPSGSEGMLMTVSLRFSGSLGYYVSGQTTYTYEWQETASGATPGPTGTGQAPNAASEDSGAILSDRSGEVVMRPDTFRRWHAPEPGEAIPFGTHIMTRANSSVTVTLPNGVTFFLKPNTEIMIDRPSERERYQLLYGDLKVVVERVLQDETLEINMSESDWVVKGTTFILEASPEASTVKVIEGAGALTSKRTGATETVGAGEALTSDKNGLGQKTAFDVDAENARWSNLAAGQDGNGTSDVEAESALWPREGGDGLPALVIVAGVIALVSLAGLIFARQRKQGT